jgi:hypothetical protein
MFLGIIFASPTRSTAKRLAKVQLVNGEELFNAWF